MAFQLNSGLWAVSADGSTERQLLKGEARRELAGWWQGELVYLEDRDGGVVAGVARPGQEAREVATLAIRQPPGNPFAGHMLYGSHLALFPGNRPPLRVDLATGAVQELSADPLPSRCVTPLPAPDGRYALIKNACEFDPVRVVDMETWTMRQAGPEGYPFFAVWSPADDRWAALAGPPGSGPVQMEAFATHLDIGDVEGRVNHLLPPHPLKLKGSPAWSADGKYLALTAEVEPPSDGRGRDAVNEFWAVTVATGQWRRLASLQFVQIQGWHPSGAYLVVWKIVGSASMPEIGTLPAAGGDVQWLQLPPPEQRDQTHLDERLMVAAGGGYQPGATAYLERPGGAPPLVLQPGQLPYKDHLQIRPPYISWIEYRGSGPAPALVVLRRAAA